jgi:DNA-binding CsgD family transcriptional regulator
MLRRAGQRRAAAQELASARATFAALGARPFLAQCEAEFGGKLTVSASDRLPLTPRQLAVATAVAAGKTNRQVAHDLYISIKTVECHISQILTRLGIDNRGDLAAALGGPGQRRPHWHRADRTGRRDAGLQPDRERRPAVHLPCRDLLSARLVTRSIP